MAAIEIIEIPDHDARKILDLEEGHFADLKAIEVGPAKLNRSVSAFSNAEGGELFVGIDEVDEGGLKVRSWRGFSDAEAANAHVGVLEELCPLGDGYDYSFLRAATFSGVVLKVGVGAWLRTESKIPPPLAKLRSRGSCPAPRDGSSY